VQDETLQFPVAGLMEEVSESEYAAAAQSRGRKLARPTAIDQRFRNWVQLVGIVAEILLRGDPVSGEKPPENYQGQLVVPIQELVSCFG
jgi:hypothetical protein